PEDAAAGVDGLRESRRLIAAEELGQQSIARWPDAAVLHVASARVALARARPEPALLLLDRAQHLGWDGDDVCRFRGSAFCAARRYREAADLARARLRSSPTDIELRVELGLVLAAQHKQVEALAEFASAATASPTHAAAQGHRITALGALRRYEEAAAA